jgi:mannose-6-phosphate isomerase-like protein (cupin superfamily)
MSKSAHSQYSIDLTERFKGLELIDISTIINSVEPWHNQTLCRVNDSVIRLGVIKGEFHWHKHDHEDEFFYVVEGKLLIDLEGRTVEVWPKQGFTVPRGVMHRTRAPERTAILMVEGAGVIPTGDE